ncbi:orotate phosphoribosyltransferase [Eubacteriales bacterium OttesenSCG-928-K08]|nr:orotate phosphoribosyltransferase [Eubacteriales bacterium OttesenSCG-928-K08]
MNETLELMKQSGAFLEGHFLLSSGLHSGGYCQCAKLLRYPDKAAKALAPVVEQIKDLGVTKICGPAMGGIIVSYELARQLNVESIFSERQDGQMTLRRGFEANPGDVILIAEDVVTTGKSTMETVRALEALGASVIGVACVVDRRSSDCALTLPVYAAVRLEIESYEADSCPLCKDGSKPYKPGSRV